MNPRSAEEKSIKPSFFFLPGNIWNGHVQQEYLLRAALHKPVRGTELMTQDSHRTLCAEEALTPLTLWNLRREDNGQKRQAQKIHSCSQGVTKYLHENVPNLLERRKAWNVHLAVYDRDR